MKISLYSTGFNSNSTILVSKSRMVCGFCPFVGSSQSRDSKARTLPVLGVDFMGKPLLVSDQKGRGDWSPKFSRNFSVQVCEYIICFVFRSNRLFIVSQELMIDNWFQAQASICVSRAMRWWEKTLKPNMVEIHSAQELVDSLLNAGDRLVIVDFYSPGCGGCKALHPKVYSIFGLASIEEIFHMLFSLN